MIDVSKEYIAKILQNARKKQGLKQSQLAEMVGISEKHLSKIETGKNYPALDNFLKIVEILQLSFKDFGIQNDDKTSQKKSSLHKIINTSSDHQLDMYYDMINMINKYL